MKLNTANQNNGFTIVELLIVIVVIGILAAITLVAFGGVRDRANTSSAQNAANQVAKKAEAYRAINSQYPADATAFNSDSTSALEGVTLGTPSSTNGKTTVSYVRSSNTCAYVHFWDFTQSGAGAITTTTANSSGNKSITLGC